MLFFVFFFNRYERTATVGNVPPRYGHAMANFGYNNNWIVMFGGRNGTSSNYGTSNEENFLFGDTWLLSAPTLRGGRWSTLRWSTSGIQSSGLSAPPKRWNHAMASLGLGSDKSTPSIVMFGGCSDSQCHFLLSDTWILKGTQNGGVKDNQLASAPIWSQVGVASAFPSKRRSHAMSFLGLLSGNKVLLFGGACASGLSTQVQLCDKKNGLTWEFDGTTWTRPTDVISPPELSPRYDMTMAALFATSWSAPLAGGFTVVMLGGKDKDGNDIKGL